MDNEQEAARLVRNTTYNNLEDTIRSRYFTCSMAEQEHTKWMWQDIFMQQNLKKIWHILVLCLTVNYIAKT